LYDNALIVSSLCDGYSITKDRRYKKIIEETIAFVETELKDKSGGYYCALDADSEGEEGKYYTWTWAEWIAVTGDDSGIAAQYFGVRPEGNWEGTNILHVAKSIDEVATEYKISCEEVTHSINEVKHKLLTVRNKRIRPLTDDKSLLSWNALMNISLSKAGVVLQNDHYLQRAGAQLEWLLKEFQNNGQLQHVWKNGIAKIPAMLDDYAYLVQALLQHASATGENKWVLKANELMNVVVSEFSHGDGFFYYTSETQKDIPVRKIDLYDGATPSANALMAHNLWICGMCMEQSKWTERALLMLLNMSDTAVRYCSSFGYWALLLQRHAAGLKTVVCAGNLADAYRQEIQANYLPQVFLITSQKEISELPFLEKKFFADKMYIFVCSEHACLSPVNSVGAAFQLLNE
ncbi:MAG: thioredoxin domain-containing protein, partial [Chitinophagales bacterium]